MQIGKVFFCCLLPLYLSADKKFLDLKDLVPKKYYQAVRQNLFLAGENGQTLYSCLKELSPVERVGASFLLANMPAIDLTEMDKETFIEHIRYAYRVWREFVWARNLSEDKFLHYLLPYRISQEPTERWRKFFYDSLKPVIKNLKTPGEVALKVNEWCGKRIKFKSTQRRDQGPFETLKSGYGRCEELMIFYIAAARSAGIACRQAWTPFWAKMDNNHAWVEVWDGQKWAFLGAAEPASTLNEAWFKNTVKGAALVYSSCFGPAEDEEEIYRREKNYSIINSTRNYVRHPARLTITLKDCKNKMIKNCPIYIYLFNFGALRPIARLLSNENGTATITINQGEYFISAGSRLSQSFKKIVVDQETCSIDLALEKREVAEGNFWLNYNQK